MAGYLDRVAELYGGFAAVHGRAGEPGPGDRAFAAPGRSPGTW